MTYATDERKAKRLKRYHTYEGLIDRIYTDQQATSRRRNHSEPNYTQQGLHDKAIKQENFFKLFEDWENSNFRRDKVPTVDRLKDEIGSTFINIQLLSWEDNRNKSYAERKSKTHKTGIEVVKMDILGNVLQIHPTIAIASRSTKIYRSGISKCLSGKYKRAGGFTWKHKCQD